MNDTIKDRVEAWEEQGIKVYSPLESSNIAAIRRGETSQDENVTKWVLMPDGELFQIDGDECSCGHTRSDEKTGMGTPWKQARQNRLSASCDHQKAVHQSVNVGGVCPDCGELKVERKNHTDQVGNSILRTYKCANCGEPRSER